MREPAAGSVQNIRTALTIITAEHAALETERSSTVFEANGRVGSYLATLSGGVVALAFIGEAAAFGRAFWVFFLVILPAQVFIGIVTFERVLQSSIEDAALARRINRLRRFYEDTEPGLMAYLTSPVTSDDAEAVMGQVGYASSSWWQPFLAAAGMVGAINSVILGVFTGVVAQLVMDRLFVTLPVGAVTCLLGIIVHHRRQQSVWSRVLARQG